MEQLLSQNQKRVISSPEMTETGHRLKLVELTPKTISKMMMMKKQPSKTLLISMMMTTERLL